MMKITKVMVALVAVAGLAQADILMNYTSGSGPNANYLMNGTASSATAAPAFNSVGHSYEGTTWNDISFAGAAALTDSTGASSGVTATLTGGARWSYNEGALGALNNYVYNSTAIAISGMGTQEYDLYIFSDGNNATGGGTFSLGTQVDRVSTGADNIGVWTEGANYVKFTKINAEGGNIGSATVNYTGDVNGFQLVAVPEPATIGLIGAFGGAMLFIRRRLSI